MNPSRVTRVLVATILGGVGASLAGCSGDSGGGGSAPGATSGPTVTVTRTVTPSGSPEDPGLPGNRTCRRVAFEAGTDAGAFDIRALGIDCAAARQVAAGAEGRRGEPYTARGFTCQPIGTAGQLPSVVYQCIGPADQTVTFKAS